MRIHTKHTNPLRARQPWASISFVSFSLPACVPVSDGCVISPPPSTSWLMGCAHSVPSSTVGGR